MIDFFLSGVLEVFPSFFLASAARRQADLSLLLYSAWTLRAPFAQRVFNLRFLFSIIRFSEITCISM